MSTGEVLVAKATAKIEADRYRTAIKAGMHDLVADEPRHVGGADAGASPFGLLLSALGACTAMTLKMYAERKNWPLEAVDVDLKYLKADDAGRIERVLRLTGALDDAQKARLADIAERTPVTLAIKGGVPIATRVA